MITKHSFQEISSWIRLDCGDDDNDEKDIDGNDDDER